MLYKNINGVSFHYLKNETKNNCFNFNKFKQYSCTKIYIQECGFKNLTI